MNKKVAILFFIFLTLSFNKGYSKEYFYSKNKDVKFIKSDFSKLKEWEIEEYKYALDAFLLSCSKFESLPNSYNIMQQTTYKITKKDFARVCEIANSIKDANNNILRVFFENYFTPFSVYDNRNKTDIGYFTGYYLPEINVSFIKNDVYKYPIYARPKNLSYTRKEINNGALNGKGLELLYTDDPIELFFLHIQGSGFGRIEETGEVISIIFDGKNIYEYTSIGKYLRERRLLTGDLSSKGIKQYLNNNFDNLDKILENNRSYIFFKLGDKDEIIGSQGVTLNSLVSLAVDTSLIPLGFPIWLETTITLPDEKIEFDRLMISQDTGSAIKGAIRGDIFFGGGKEAEEIASYQYGKGKYFILIPNNIADKLVK